MKVLKAALKIFGILLLAVFVFHSVFAFADVGLPNSWNDMPRWIRDLGENAKCRVLMMPVPRTGPAGGQPGISAPQIVIVPKADRPEPSPVVTPPPTTSGPADPTPTPPISQVPQPMPKASPRLSPNPTPLGGYEIQLPKGYRMAPMLGVEEIAGLKDYVFASPPTPAGDPCNISIHICSLLKPGETLNDLLADMVKSRKESTRQAVFTEVQSKTIHDIPFRVFAWSGDHASGKQMMGVTFIGLDDKNIIAFHCQGTAQPEIAPYMKAGEESMTTFRRKPSAK